MRAGQLRHYVEIQQASIVTDANGDGVRQWSTYAFAWASVEPLSGREYFAAQQIASDVSAQIRMRYLAGVTEKMRVVANGVTYGIESVLHVGNRGRELVLMASAGSGHAD